MVVSSGTTNPVWIENAVRKAERAIIENHEAAWEIGCLEHGTARALAVAAVAAILGISVTQVDHEIADVLSLDDAGVVHLENGPS